MFNKYFERFFLIAFAVLFMVWAGLLAFNPNSIQLENLERHKDKFGKFNFGSVQHTTYRKIYQMQLKCSSMVYL